MIKLAMKAIASFWIVSPIVFSVLRFGGVFNFGNWDWLIFGVLSFISLTVCVYLYEDDKR